MNSRICLLLKNQNNQKQTISILETTQKPTSRAFL
nr:MAG TPA: hypothetical protein [Caudoviricetes sp.]